MDIISHNKSVLVNKRFSEYLDQGGDRKIIIFAIPRVQSTGDQNVQICFPLEGEIVEVSASCSFPGISETVIQIEKCSQTDFENIPNWVPVLSQQLVLEAGKKSSNQADTPPAISSTQVNQNDYFRINFLTVGSDVNGVTVEVIIKIF